MSIFHNFTDVSDSTSCLDPFAEYLDGGTAIGKSYVIRKIFENFLSVCPTAREITNASPTPDWLQDEAQYLSYYNIPTDVALTRSTAGDHVRFYFTDDPGLTQATPRCMIYTWCVHPSSNNYYDIMHNIFAYKISGSAAYVPAGQPNPSIGGNSVSYARIMWGTSGSTSTTRSNDPRISIWGSSNAICVCSWDRVSGAYRGGFLLFRPTTWSGYTTGAAIVPGANANTIMMMGDNSDWHYFDGTNSVYEYVAGGRLSLGGSNFPPRMQVVSALGRLPSVEFNISGQQRLVGSKMGLSIASSEMCAASGEIEGILLANTSIAPATGTISTYNTTTRYLSIFSIQDGMTIHRILLQLS